jgi:superfamily II DNA or RNA helicase
LIDQWVERILEHTTLKRNDIGFVNGRQCLWKGKSVVIALVNSIILPDYLGADFREYFGHVAWDEVHTTVPPKTFAEAGGQFAGRYRTGASATLDRFDGMDKVFEKHLEQVRIHGEDPDPVIPIVNVVNFKGSSGNIPSWVKGTNQRRGWLLKALGLNEERNRLLAQRIRKRYDEGYRPVVLSDRKRQLQVLNTMIRGGIPGKEIGLYVGSINGKKVDDEELTKIKKTARVILATPGMMKLGQDISSLDCMIYATPTADPRQSSGRIRRKKTGKQTPVIDDLVDEAYSETRRWWQRRRAFYRGAGFEIKGGGL